MYSVLPLNCRTTFSSHCFPAILFLLALASFFPLSNITDDVSRSVGPFVSPQVLELIKEQMQRLANNENGGLLTFGVAGALWSSSAALVSIVGALNRAYDIEEGRPWWKVRLVAIGLTLGVALVVLMALSLVLVGPTLAEKLGQSTGWGAPFEWTWLIVQWPLVFALITVGIALIYYFGPDADHWVWITPGAVAATILWLVVSLLFKLYVANFTDYEGSYGTVGGVIVVLLWFYVSGIAILTGAEMNAEIEHASPHGKAPGQKNAQGKRLLGARAEKAFRERQSEEPQTAKPAPLMPPPRPKPALGAASDVAGAVVESSWRFGKANQGGVHIMSDSRLNPPLKELLTSISTDIQLLASQTLTLARLEIATAASTLAWSAIGVMASVFVAIAGLAVLVDAIVLILIALGLPAWAASTLVGMMLTGSGALAARYFVGSMRRAEQTIAVAGREARLGRCKEDRPSAPSSDRRDAGGYRRCARGLDRTSLTERIVEREGRHGKEDSETRRHKAREARG